MPIKKLFDNNTGSIKRFGKNILKFSIINGNLEFKSKHIQEENNINRLLIHFSIKICHIPN